MFKKSFLAIFTSIIFLPIFAKATGALHYEKAKVISHNSYECVLEIKTGKFKGRNITTIFQKECEKNNEVYVKIVEENFSNLDSMVSATIIFESKDLLGGIFLFTFLILTFLIGGVQFMIANLFFVLVFIFSLFATNKISNILSFISILPFIFILFFNRKKISFENYLFIVKTTFISIIFGLFTNFLINKILFEKFDKINSQFLLSLFFSGILVGIFSQKEENKKISILSIFDSKKQEIEKGLVNSILAGNSIIFLTQKTEFAFLKGIFSNFEFLSSFQHSLILIISTILTFIIISTKIQTNNIAPKKWKFSSKIFK